MGSIQTWGEAVSSSLLNLWLGFASFLPLLIGAVVVFIVGLIIASVLGKAVERILKAAQVDRAMEKFGAQGKLKMIGIDSGLSGFMGLLVKWFLVIVFLMASTNILGMGQVTEFLRSILLFVPNIIVATIILSAAFMVGSFSYTVIRSSTRAAGIMSSEFLGRAARAAIIVFGVLIALQQIGIATATINILITGIIAAMSLAFGLAFGLGGRDEAAALLKKLREELSQR